MVNPQKLKLEIQALGNRVGGISRRSGSKTVFVRGALPGEIVLCAPEMEKKSYVEARLLEILRPSPHRIEPSCVNYSWCGGCSLQHLEYSRQLHWKREWVRNAMRRRRVAGEAPSEVTASPAIIGYRNRVTFEVVDGRPGLHAFRGDPRPVERCPLLPPQGNELLAALSRQGLEGWKRVAIRSSTGTGSQRVELYGSGEATQPKLADGVGVAWRVGERWNSAGPELRERLAGISLHVPPGGFLQVNTGAAERMVALVTRLCGPGRVLDLYGGVGTFGLPLAASGRRVLTVERCDRSVRSGSEAAREQGLDGIRFLSRSARSYLVQAVRGGESFDTVVADPPRSGLGTRVARLLRRLLAHRIILVGCDPFAMARDLEVLLAGGYHLQKMHALDLFPQTDHVETVALLERDAPKQAASGRGKAD